MLLGVKLDTDDPEHIDWVYNEAVKRATAYNIEGVDLRLTKGVLKRIIPAVASTNAVIAGNKTHFELINFYMLLFLLFFHIF